MAGGVTLILSVHLLTPSRCMPPDPDFECFDFRSLNVAYNFETFNGQHQSLNFLNLSTLPTIKTTSKSLP